MSNQLTGFLKRLAIKQYRTEVVPASALRCFVIILDFVQTNRRSPTIKELRTALGYGSNFYVQQSLARLRDCGLIEYQDRRGRTIRPLFRLEVLEP